MNELIENLGKKVSEVANSSKLERLKWIESQKWVGYPLAHTVIQRLEWLINHEPTDRMPNLLLYGETNNGKTTIVRHYASMKGSFENEETGAIEFPVLYMQMPPSPEESRFYDSLLNILMAPYRQRDSISRKQSQAITIMRNLGVKLLIIDEFHHLLVGRIDKQRLFLQSMKYLGNELRIPIVAVGTEDALRAIRVVPQISNRFQQIELPKWKSNTSFKRLLMSFEMLLPLKEKSLLHIKPMYPKLHSMCEGNLGELFTLLKQAAREAIENGNEKITIKQLQNMNWIQPSARVAEI